MQIVIDPYPEPLALDAFWRRAWGSAPPGNYRAVLERGIAHVGSYDGERLTGFVNVAWDGGVHAFILDTAVDPDYRRQGLATRLVAAATEVARERGAEWLHVDFEPHLTDFYRGCGFRHSEAGLIRLR